MSTVERTALKEWAVLAEAMGAGEIIAVVRKGGIREQRKGFAVRHDRFLLYPTWFHEKAAELDARFHDRLAAVHERRPGEGTIRLEYLAEAVAVWRVTELDALRGVGHEHGLAWSAVESRFRYRDIPQVHVAALRISALEAPVVLPEARRYLGCVSWVELDGDVRVDAARPVLPEERLQERVTAMSAALGPPLSG